MLSPQNGSRTRTSRFLSLEYESILFAAGKQQNKASGSNAAYSYNFHSNVDHFKMLEEHLAFGCEAVSVFLKRLLYAIALAERRVVIQQVEACL